jgi:hypothetical protein
MPTTRVLQIGMDPDVIDFSPWPGQDADGLRARIAKAAYDLQESGFSTTICLLPNDTEAASSAVSRFLSNARYDVVEIGSGLRTSHEFTAIFERVVNEVAALQPGIRFCFNDSPESTLEAVRRSVTR